MGVFSKLRDLDDLASDLGTSDPVAVISCNNCVRACGSGGEAHLTRICQELRTRGVRIEDEILITNPCSRAYLAEYDPGSAVRVCLLLACTGAEAAFATIYPEIRTVVGIETIGLFMNSKTKGRLKLATPFDGYEHLTGKEFALGDSDKMFDDEQLAVPTVSELST